MRARRQEAGKARSCCAISIMQIKPLTAGVEVGGSEGCCKSHLGSSKEEGLQRGEGLKQLCRSQRKGLREGKAHQGEQQGELKDTAPPACVITQLCCPTCNGKAGSSHPREESCSLDKQGSKTSKQPSCSC